MNMLKTFTQELAKLLNSKIIKRKEKIHSSSEAEKALRECETKFRNVFNLSVVGKSMTSIDGQLKTNQAFCEILGYSEVELSKLNWQDITHPDHIENDIKIINSIVSGEKENVRWEKRYIHKNGSIVWVDISTSLARDNEGKPLYFITSILDITDRKRMEEKDKKRIADLAESEERFRQLSKATFEAIIIHQEGVLIQANDQYYNLFGYKSEEMLGRQVMPMTTAPQSLKILGEQIASGGTGPYIATGLRKDGTTFPMEIRAQNMEYKGIRVRVSAILDISLRIQAEMELHERTVALELANKELEAFSYSVSHDLRAPLRHMNGYVDLLKEKFHDDLPEKGKHYLDNIADSAHQMGVLIDDLLEFSRTGRQEMMQANISMNGVLEEVLNNIKAENPERTIEWLVGTLPQVYGDFALLRLVWYNLISNAVKFTRLKQHARIEVGYQTTDKEYIFFVRDNGVGFDMQYAQKLFGVFQRLHSSEDFEGTGIGLANVRRIVLKHGGHTWADAEIDKGATIYFTIPKNEEVNQ
jgi:PAS domain S-box-containing protein